MTRGGKLAVAFYPHHIEHLAPLCALLDMPMLVCDSPGQAAAAACYPQLDVTWLRGIDHATPARDAGARVREMAPQVIFYSHLFLRPALRALLTMDGTPPPRVVHCPHGFSEKRQDWSQQVAFQDIALLQGRFALDQLAQMGVGAMLYYFTLAGNLRRDHYHAHRAFFDAQARALGVASDARMRTVLYAPTWSDKVGASSFFAALLPLVQDLPHDWRLVVKLHPLLEENAAAVDALSATCREHANVVLLRNCPLTYPLLQQADVYVGDMSSLAYDYLAYDRPMVLLNQAHGTTTDSASSRLFNCGVTLAPADYARIHAVIDRACSSDAGVFTARRAELDAYVYAPSPPAAELRATLAQLTSGPAPSWMDPRWAQRAAAH